MAAQYDIMGTYIGDFETEEERKKREALADTAIHTQEVKTYGDGTVERVTKEAIPAGVAGPVSPQTVFDRIIQAESGGRQLGANGQILTSPKGAQGIAQIMPSTAANPGYGVRPATPEEIATPEGNRAFGERYFQGLLKHFGGDVEKATAAYNGGPGRVSRNIEANAGQLNMAQMPQETQQYVQTVLGAAPQTQMAQAQPQLSQAQQAHAQRQPGMLERAVNAIIPSAQAQPVPQAAPVVQPQAAPVAPQALPAYAGPGQGEEAQTVSGPVPVQQAQPVPPTAQAAAAPMAGPAPNSFDEFGTPIYSPAQANLDKHLNTMQQGQGNIGVLDQLRNDVTAPSWLREQAGSQAYDLMSQEVNKAKAQKQAESLAQAASGGDRKAANTIARELQNQDGSWLKMILLGFISPQMAGEEAIKLGFGNKWTSSTDQDGKPVLIQTNAKGLPLKGYKADGTEIATEDLVRFGGGKRELDLVGGSYVNDKTGEVGRMVSDKKTGNTYIQTDAGPRPMSGFRPQSTTGSMDMQKAQLIQKQNVDLAGDWAKLQMKVQGAAPEAANKYLGEFGAKYGVTPTLQTINGPAPQISMETGQMVVPGAVPTPAVPAGAPAVQAQPVAQGAVAPTALPASGARPPAVAAQIPAVIEQAGKTGGVAQEQFVKTTVPTIIEQGNNGRDVASIRRQQLQIIASNPSILGIYNRTGTDGDRARNVITKLVTGEYGQDNSGDLYKEVSALRFSDTERAAIEHMLTLNMTINQKTLRANSGPGAVSNIEQKINANSNLSNFTETTPLGALLGLNSTKFNNDLAHARSVFAQQNPQFNTDIAFNSAWDKEQTKWLKAYEGIAQARSDFLKPFRPPAGATAQQLDAFKDKTFKAFEMYPAPAFDPGQPIGKQWSYGTSYAEKAAAKRLLGIQ
jgi:hypothetical protein